MPDELHHPSAPRNSSLWKLERQLTHALENHGGLISGANQRSNRARGMPTCRFGCLNDRSDQTCEASEVKTRNRTQKTRDENLENIRLRSARRNGLGAVQSARIESISSCCIEESPKIPSMMVKKEV